MAGQSEIKSPRQYSAGGKICLATDSEDVKQQQEGDGFTTDEIIVERDNQVEEIIKNAEERNCDLVVMGTHGQGTLADVMLGSTARRVIRRSKIPVLVVRLPEA